MYEKIFKRLIDFNLSLIIIILLLPLFIVLIILGAIIMRGNPFFVQKRIGKNEKIFSLIKFRTMNNKKDLKGILLPDSLRLNKYGRFLRSTSCDELPSLINILFGNLSLIGPRPLLERYLGYFTEEEHHRHDVRPGLTGLAQVNGRSYISWEQIFIYDLYYIKKITFIGDLKIFLNTIYIVIFRKSIADSTLIKKNENGKLYVKSNGVEYILHEPLDIERQHLL